MNIQRVSVGDSRTAEAVAVSPREILINGKTVGETSLIVWQAGGNRLLFDLHVRPSTTHLEAVRQEMEKELGPDITVTQEDGNVYLRGTAKDLTSAQRALAIASTLGKPVNLLNVRVPGVEEQILLKVRFATIDRAASRELGVNLFGTGALNTPGSITTGSFSPPRMTIAGNAVEATLSDALNIFLFRPDLDVGATIRALQTRNLGEILSEPNLLAMNGRPASFLAGGEFPFPVVQSGVGGAGAVTIQWREFGVRLNFLPTITPRGTIRLTVEPEVSSLDPSRGVTVSGFSVPAISTRRVKTEIELESGQTFALAGLLDNNVTENWAKIPGLGDIPLIGKLFQSRRSQKGNSELLVIVTPELVRPVPVGQPQPGLVFPEPWLKDAPTTAPRQPGINITGPVPVKSAQESVPVEQLQKLMDQLNPPPAAPQAPMMYLPMMMPGGQATPPVAPEAPASGGAAATTTPQGGAPPR